VTRTDVEIVRSTFEAAADGDVGVWFRACDPDIGVFPRPAEPDAKREYRGLDELMEYLVNWFGQWEEYEFEPVSLDEAGGHVLAVIRERGRSEGSGIEVEEDFTHSFRLREGKVVEWRMYDSHAEARAALGLSS
jgi:ketosteroid isomerase-like protein